MYKQLQWFVESKKLLLVQQLASQWTIGQNLAKQVKIIVGRMGDLLFQLCFNLETKITHFQVCFSYTHYECVFGLKKKNMTDHITRVNKTKIANQRTICS